MIYTAAEIGSSGNISQVGFYLNSVSTPGAAPTKIYLKTVTNSAFAAATTVASEISGATLVYDATIPASAFVANTWVSVPLTTPFAYNGTSNLEVIVETNAAAEGNESSTGKVFRYATTGVARAQFWNEDNTAPVAVGVLSATRPNIRLTGLTPASCAAPTALAVSAITATSAQLAFTAGTGNTSYTVTYYPTATPASVTTVTPAPTASPVTLSGLLANTAYTLTVVANCSATSSSQQVTTSFTTSSPADDAAVTAVFTLGKVSTYSSPVTVQAVVRNAGSAAITNRIVVLSVSGATTFTNAQTIASLAPGASTTVTFAAYPVTATTGANTVTVTLAADDVATNNVRTYAQAITAGQLSYIDASQPVTASVGVSSTTPNGILAVKYTTNQASVLNEVRLEFLANATTTSTYQVVVLNAAGTGGTPGTALFTSPTLNRPTAAGIVTVPITGNITVNGPFFVGLKEISGNVGIGYQVEDPLRPGTFYFQSPATGAWAEVNTTALRTRLAIEVGFRTVTATRSIELANAIDAFPNPATEAFTLNLPALGGERTAQLTLVNSLGQLVQTRTLTLNAAGTQTQMEVGHLAKGLYTLKVQAGNQLATKQIVVQ
ncbi:hypothetical protein GCM10023186_02680 [Hymenobacter koreensis]|uniref:Fibronectin type-III domain-containing protein n=2 Tax=Hymenobacter koreensis TaxID=1084523 RepID=A0ABP8ITT5_9BACT